MPDTDIGELESAAAYAEGFLLEDPILRAARARAEEVGIVPVSPGTGAVLRFLAAAVGARAVVEIGTGTGVSGTWLLRGMRPDGTLTTIDVEAEHLRLARRTYADAGMTPGRSRLITGRALDVLPRLTDGAYDLVFCDADRREGTEYLTQALRLLRPGGVVAFASVLALAQGQATGPEAVAVRELATAVRDDVRLTQMLLTTGGGLLVAVVAKSSPVG
ncbi:methyltransferase [Frankia sp. CcI156]|jgi:predicted O-methyltransferase YrrM|uniref:O-methyltransferase, family 3 n=2 Tax=Frankia casuarinae (strain DSM 45818 / CECT 9043 / HFP020203 / CcI3) TaxID=106370 RepID=Q2J6A8_FRACC|nr:MULTISPECIES: class I SAM-dependent methyltransferase [Frankia]ABD13184.1 O-methyltransferase, family 3 [Frankia casuarinae]ETA00565.1 putative O-methyltransferase [Frankia sp. CcI6]EYT93703.1 putative O-methyltransferase [Frankia casuarinae]KDA41525.1 putative O-methyltransferase [Frankia sp. BMG5.23]OFB40537.1 methyltransferase [Frankia sp. CgIM4]